MEMIILSEISMMKILEWMKMPILEIIIKLYAILFGGKMKNVLFL